MTLVRLLLAPLVAVGLLPVVLLNAFSLALADLAWLLFGRRRPRPPAAEPTARPASLSVVIPSWNARDLLEKFLPSVVRAASFHSANEVIVVDNASEDGTAAFLAERFPEVRVLRLERNLGFGGGNNAGVRAARHRVVVVLNNDMRVEEDAFERLLDGFTDSGVFAVSAQIFFLDRGRRREETGLTEGRFEDGFFRFGHRVEDLRGLYPATYAGGGSTAYDREKFLELGGFDPLFHPFYVEDADLSYAAWKRGWKVLYQPAAVVHHEHRGTIGKRFSPESIDAILKKNHALMVWKNAHRWSWLAGHFFFLYTGILFSFLLGAPTHHVTLRGYWRATAGWGKALACRWRARSLAVVDDAEAVRRPLPAFYRDRFLAPSPVSDDRPLRILFVAPYSIYPPLHGGAVFMHQAVQGLARRNEVHVLAFVDSAEQAESNRALEKYARSVECVVRDFHPRRDVLGLTPYAVRHFRSADFERRLHRLIWERDIDLVQLEYVQMAQYGGGWRHTPAALFQHEVYSQSVRGAVVEARQPGELLRALGEWLRALRYELRALPAMDLVQTCSEDDRRLLESFLGRAGPPVRAGLRAGIDASAYLPRFGGREPDSVLFLGNFRHAPNVSGLRFLVRQVLPRLRRERPQATLYVAGAEPDAAIERLCAAPGVRFLGAIHDVREALHRYAVFAAPIQSGSGVRVKILEAFAAGIPVVSTPVGAEGLEMEHGTQLLLARSARAFASAIIGLLNDPAQAEAMARRARLAVEQRWDSVVVIQRLEEAYREMLRQRRPVAEERASLAALDQR